MRRLLRLWLPLPLLLLGCAGSFEEAKIAGRGVKLGAPPPSPECVALDGAHRDWSSVAAGAAVLSGASGIASIPDYDSKELRIGLAAGAAVSATVAAVAVKRSDSFGESWARQCQN